MIGYDQRTLHVGMTQSGKSTLLGWLFSQLQNRRALVDPKGEWQLPGVPRYELRARTLGEARAELATLDREAPVFHFKPRWYGPTDEAAKAQLEALYGFLDRLPGALTVWTDEAYGVCSEGWAPSGLVALTVAGASRGKGSWCATQRPVTIAKPLRTEADHIFLHPPLEADDLKELRKLAPFVPAAWLDETLAALPEFGYVWIDKRAKRYSLGDPLPDYLRASAQAVVRGRQSLTRR
jgi:hypothetical protein